MVELGVPTVRFGLPPEKGKPVPQYPGVSPTAFDDTGQLKVYREILDKEKSCRVHGNMVAETVLKTKPIYEVGGNMGDIMPGYKSIRHSYSRLGYEMHPI